MLHLMKSNPKIEIVGLLTTFNRDADRVAMHSVRRELTLAQATAAGLPLFSIDLPWPCSNADYERQMRASLDELTSTVEFNAIAFGDLFLEDIRAYRVEQLDKWGYEPLFPLWRLETRALAHEMIEAGLNAVLTCVDPRQCPQNFAGRHFDQSLLAELPATVDPCGENGEFHTFAFEGPMFAEPIGIVSGEIVGRDGFVFADVLLNQRLAIDSSSAQGGM